MTSSPPDIKNNHGNCFVEFIKSNRALILNGRVTPQYNNFTYVTARGNSVPDYLFTPMDNLSKCKEVKIHLMTDIINQNNLVPPDQIPDHSILTGTFRTAEHPTPNAENTVRQKETTDEQSKKKNINKINDDFFMTPEIREQVNEMIRKLEENATNQDNIDKHYADIKALFAGELDKLPDKCSNNAKQNKNKRQGSAFWNEELG